MSNLYWAAGFCGLVLWLWLRRTGRARRALSQLAARGEVCYQVSSPNKKYTVGVIPHEHRIYGRYAGMAVLFRGRRPILWRRLQDPMDCKVSDTGTVVVNDYMRSKKEPAGKFYVYSRWGKRLICRHFKANLLDSAISQDGCWAMCQTAYSDCEDDSGVLCLFDLRSRKLSRRIRPHGGFGQSYAINAEDCLLFVRYEGFELRYDFEGNLLNPRTWETMRIKTASGYQLIDVALEKLGKLSGSTKWQDYAEGR